MYSNSTDIKKRSIPNLMKLALIALTAAVLPAIAPAAAPSMTEARQTILQTPLAFEPNQGQADPAYRFVSRGAGFALGIGDSELALRLDRSVSSDPTLTPLQRRQQLEEASRANTPTITLLFSGTSNADKLSAEAPLPGVSNYFTSPVPAQSPTAVPHYGKVRWSGAYPGIDVVYYADRRQLEYDFVVSPGASPDPIAVSLAGISSLKLQPDGAIKLHPSADRSEPALTMHKPVAYQLDGAGARETVDARYTVDASHTVRFALGEYDRSRELVIDPVLLYATYLGGSGTDEIYGMDVDNSGKIYVTGVTTGSFPTKTGSYRTTYRGGSSDAFVTKINPAVSGSGGVVYSTYLGGSDIDIASGIRVDSSGSAYIVGDTKSTNFPLTKTFGTQGSNDVFITKLNAAGSGITYSAIIGGYGADLGLAIALDSSNQVYAAGSTSSTNFPIKSAIQSTSYGAGDAFVFSLNASGTAAGISTYLGGNSEDVALGIAVDSTNNRVLICGRTASTNFLTKNPLQAINFGGATDAFLTILGSSGTSVSFSSYFGGAIASAGGNAADVATAVAIDADKNIYLTGYTSSLDFPVQRALFSSHGGGVYDAFLMKLTPTANALISSTFYGDSGSDVALALAVTSTGRPVMGGTSLSSQLPIVNSEDDYHSGGDGFIATFAPTLGAIDSAFYIGGDGGEDIVYALETDPLGGLYAAGITESNDLNTFGAAQSTFGGATDGFVAMYVPSTTLDDFDGFSTTAGWAHFGPNIPGLVTLDHDAANSALRVYVHADPNRYRISGWMTDPSNLLPYSAVGNDHIIRAKFYLYTTGQTNPAALNTIPNMRLRLSSRWAVNSMLEVFNHLNVDPGTDPLSKELRPSADPNNPSLYRVDFDPIDVPQLVNNPNTEGISRAFEAFSTDPQDNGYVALTESTIGVYPSNMLGTPLSAPHQWYTSSVDAGGLKLSLNLATLLTQTLIPGTLPGQFPVEETDSMTPEPVHSEGPNGVTLDTSAVPAGLIGVLSRDFSPGTNRASFLRVEEGVQYRLRYHLTSTQQSNLNAQIRLRARSVQFSWAQKLEIGGALAADNLSNTIAAQALPGVGSMNPDKDSTENGGWYTMIFHSPLNADIRPETGGTLGARMPNLYAEPGPGVNATSRRDLRVGLDLLDTASVNPASSAEQGIVTVDRIEVTEHYLVDD